MGDLCIVSCLCTTLATTDCGVHHWEASMRLCVMLLVAIWGLPICNCNHSSEMMGTKPREPGLQTRFHSRRFFFSDNHRRRRYFAPYHGCEYCVEMSKSNISSLPY